MAGPAGHPGRGPKAAHALTFDPDHPMGAGHLGFLTPAQALLKELGRDVQIRFA